MIKLHNPNAALQEVLEKEFDEAQAFEDESKNEDGKSEKGAELAAELEIQDAVFMSSYIPRSLHEVGSCCCCYCCCW